MIVVLVVLSGFRGLPSQTLPSLPASPSRLPCVPCKCLPSNLQGSDSPIWHPRKRYSNHEAISNCCSWQAVLIWTTRIHSMSKQTAEQFSWVTDLDCIVSACIAVSQIVQHKKAFLHFSVCSCCTAALCFLSPACPFGAGRARWVAELKGWEWRGAGSGEAQSPGSPSAWAAEQAVLPGWCLALHCSSLPATLLCLSWSRCCTLLDFSSPFPGKLWGRNNSCACSPTYVRPGPLLCVSGTVWKRVFVLGFGGSSSCTLKGELYSSL